MASTERKRLPVDEATLRSKGFRPYRKTVVTYARQIHSRFTVSITSGARLDGRAGDYACYSPTDGSRWVVERDIFHRTYSPLSLVEAQRSAGPAPRLLLVQGYRPYFKHQITWARKLHRARMVHTIEGDVRANPGDYLCIGPDGEQWPQAAARFEATYEPVESV